MKKVIALLAAIMLLLSACSSATLDDAGFEETETVSNESTSTENQILISGIPAQDVFRLSVDEIITNFGVPDTQSSNLIQYRIRDEVESTFYDDGWISFEVGSEGRVSSYSTDPANLTFNNQNLGKDSETVISILGDNFEVVETTGYSWIAAWDYGNYQISFEFPRNNGGSEDYAEAFAAVVNQGQTAPDGYATRPYDEGLSGGYGQGEGNASYLVTDPLLVGRWRSYDGSALTLEDTGYATTYFKFWYGLNPDPEYVTWEAYDGRLILSAHCSFEYEWKLSSEIPIYRDTEVDVLDLGRGGKYRREKTGGTDLTGTWTSAEEWGSDLTLYPDGTGMEGRYPITWWVDGNILHYNTTESSTFDYTVSGDTLTVFFSDGSRIYTRVGN